MDKIRPYLIETTRALVVLALILLNLGHQATPSLALDGFAVTSGISGHCGSPDDPGATKHRPCHACRINADVVLPPAPCLAEPLNLDFAGVDYSPLGANPLPLGASSAHRSRGPPVLA